MFIVKKLTTKITLIVFFGLLIISRTRANGQLRIYPSSGFSYDNCYQPYIIIMDTFGKETLSVDSKLFLDGLNFNINTGYKTYETGDMDNMILPFLYGTATNGDKINQKYLYINTSQNKTAINGNNINIATLYLKPDAFITNTYIDFYFLKSRNGDDSNISNSIDNKTQMKDILDNVITGSYLITGYKYCPSRPRIISGEYQQYTREITNTGPIKVLSKVKAGPIYQTGDYTWNPRTNSIGRTVRTKENIILSITGDNLIRILPKFQKFKSNYISGINNVTSGRTINKRFIITGNMFTGYLSFENEIGNMGNTYLSGTSKYDYNFFVDVFRIDQVKPGIQPFFTGFVSSEYNGATTYSISGSDFKGRPSNIISGQHAIGSIKDEEFVIIHFTGASPANTIYAENTYADFLNNTGYILSGDNTFKLKHNIIFRTPFVGTAVIMDRAGNTGAWFINLPGKVQYGIIAYPSPQSRDDIETQSGMLLKIAVYTHFKKAEYDDISCPDESVIRDNLAYKGWVKTSSTGRGTFTGYFIGIKYDVVVSSINGLGNLMTGVLLGTTGGIIDYRVIGNRGLQVLGNTMPIESGPPTHARYTGNITTTNEGCSVRIINNGPNVQDGEININDLATMTLAIEKNRPSERDNQIGIVGIFSGEYFVDIMGSYRFGLEELNSRIVKISTMAYHPYDIDGDGRILGSDFGKIINNLNKRGYKMPR